MDIQVVGGSYDGEFFCMRTDSHGYPIMDCVNMATKIEPLTRYIDDGKAPCKLEFAYERYELEHEKLNGSHWRYILKFAG